MKDYLDKTILKVQFRLNQFLTEERGDTNFISILIILGIVILLAGVFIGFKDTIVEQVQRIVNGFSIDSSGSGATGASIKIIF